MAEQTAAGVYFKENDQSFTQPTLSSIGAAFIGPTVKGRAFVPTDVSSYSEYVSIFGGANGESYVPYAVEQYLNNTEKATIVRVLSDAGYSHTQSAAIVMSSSNGERLVGIVHHTNSNPFGTYSNSTPSTYTSPTGSVILLSGSATSAWGFTASFISTDVNSLDKIMGSSQKTSNSGSLYTYFKNYANSIASISGATFKIVSSSASTFTLGGYSEASTPWIVSQKVGGLSTNLFKVKTLSHGDYNNTEFKIAISDIRKSTEVSSDYGTFSLTVRSATDTDKNPIVYETWSGLTLDTTSPNYISRVIGDRVKTYNSANKKVVSTGDYDNLSKYIVIEVNPDVTNRALSNQLIPFGFAAVKEPVSVTGFSMPTASMVTSQDSNLEYNYKVHYGYDYNYDSSDNFNYLKPISTTATSGLNVGFNLDDMFTHPSSSVGRTSMSGSTLVSARKFIVPFQGGFDGSDPATPKNMGLNISTTNTMGFNLSANADGNKAYSNAIELLSNTQQYFVNLLFTPGVIKTLHSSIVQKTIDMCEERGNTLYVFDPVKMDELNIANVISSVSTIDSSYSTCYYPWTQIFDSNNNQYMWVPGSVPVGGAYSYNDKYGFEWFAPAGFNRASMSSVKTVYNQLSKPEIGDLSVARVNPIANFPNSAPVVWAQRTLQAKTSALDRVNVRRLLINLKYFIEDKGKYFNFESNTPSERNKFYNQVNPYLDYVQSKNGLYAFKVVIDETTNPGEQIDRYIMKMIVGIQPTKTSEIIQVDFNITPTGATFNF